MAPTVKRLVSWIKGLDAARPFEAFQIEITSRCNLNCVMCPVTVLADQWPARNLNDRPLMETWEGAAYHEFRKRFARRVAGASAMMLGATRAVATAEESPAPDACRTCPKLYGV